ncbi:protocatechuate 3,4-dioxygenase subunit beta [Pendulispora albinea]|uniref:Protocatechuate 3,4-dioxygenase subunit beta n=1 Tax=Pendulispora albinea TaxID=2741071 RepID=A0ABZ2M4P8_9BACT
MNHGTYRPPIPGSQPPYAYDPYGSTRKRAPKQPLVRLPTTWTEASGPSFSPAVVPPIANLAKTAEGREAIGERIVVAGKVTDEDGRPVPGTMIELWQANATGRYDHGGDQHDAPLDPNFRGIGRVFTDDEGRYRFTSIKPGAYPWRNHPNAWRPNHIHFSLFGAGYASRLITQMYFPGDPLLAIDPVYNSIPDPDARARLVSTFDIELTMPEYALGYRFDLVLRGLSATPFENG